MKNVVKEREVWYHIHKCCSRNNLGKRAAMNELFQELVDCLSKRIKSMVP